MFVPMKYTTTLLRPNCQEKKMDKSIRDSYSYAGEYSFIEKIMNEVKKSDKQARVIDFETIET